MAGADACYTLMAADDASENPSLQELKNQLEKGDDEQRIATMKKILNMMLNGDPMPQLLMFVIRFVMPSKNKILKKLLLLYYEVASKKNTDGKLKQEFILVCNALRNDLQHPNEYIRGCVLRFLCKLRETEVLEPLVPSVRACLEHRHPYVRKNAIFAIYTIHKFNENLIPDAPELVQTYLSTEQDMACRRNAFIMLYNADQNRAIDYLNSIIDQVASFPESLQLSIVELIRKVCRTSPSERSKYIRVIHNLLSSPAHAVKYESAAALMSLSTAAVAVKAAASCYASLLLKESDNNVKLIVLDRINDLRERHGRVLDDLVMDILRVLASPDIEVRRKCLRIAMDMVATRNVNDVVAFLKKEIMKTRDDDADKNTEYRQLLVQTIHQCAIRFSEVAASVIHTMMEFLGDAQNDSAHEVISFVREVMERFPSLRADLLQKLLDCFADMRSARVLRSALWVIGEYAMDAQAINAVLETIRSILGELPILAVEQREAERLADELGKEAAAQATTPAVSTPSTRVVVLADGTYATQSSYSSDVSVLKSAGTKAIKPPLRALLLDGDFFIGSVLGVTLTKLALRYEDLPEPAAKKNAVMAEALLVITSILRLGKSDLPPVAIDADSSERLAVCLRVLLEPNDMTKTVFATYCRESYSRLLQMQMRTVEKKEDVMKKVLSPDEQIVFRHLKAKRSAVDELDDQYELDLERAMGGKDKDESISKLNRIVQLTGHSDPVYAEAYVNVHQYDILLDVLVVNQTGETLQNVALELATLGDLKLVERPSTHTLAAHDFLNIKANIKVSSTDTGVIFGNIVYDTTTTSDSNVVVLNDIHIDIMDYIQPANCTDLQFRQMWVDFEWENKVLVNTNMAELHEYLNTMMSRTNMHCLTPPSALEGDCGFLAANLYARSIFGEDALANLCIEKAPNGRISGHIRIRAKTQGIALSLGDKWTSAQKL